MMKTRIAGRKLFLKSPSCAHTRRLSTKPAPTQAETKFEHSNASEHYGISKQIWRCRDRRSDLVAPGPRALSS